MDENILKTSDAMRNMAYSCHQVVEEISKDQLGLDPHASIALSLPVNIFAYALAIAIECQSRGLPFSELIRLTKDVPKSILDNMSKINQFCFDEILTQSNPGAVRVQIEIPPDEERGHGQG